MWTAHFSVLSGSKFRKHYCPSSSEFLGKAHFHHHQPSASPCPEMPSNPSACAVFRRSMQTSRSWQADRVIPAHTLYFCCCKLRHIWTYNVSFCSFGSSSVTCPPVLHPYMTKTHKNKLPQTKSTRLFSLAHLSLVILDAAIFSLEFQVFQLPEWATHKNLLFELLCWMPQDTGTTI